MIKSSFVSVSYSFFGSDILHMRMFPKISEAFDFSRVLENKVHYISVEQKCLAGHGLTITLRYPNESN